MVFSEKKALVFNIFCVHITMSKYIFILLEVKLNSPEKSASERRALVAVRDPRCLAIFLQQTRNTKLFIITIIKAVLFHTYKRNN